MQIDYAKAIKWFEDILNNQLKFNWGFYDPIWEAGLPREMTNEFVEVVNQTNPNKLKEVPEFLAEYYAIKKYHDLNEAEYLSRRKNIISLVNTKEFNKDFSSYEEFKSLLESKLKS